MPKNFSPNAVNRIIDANINRIKEGLRVCEEITRFLLESRALTAEFKNIRHKIDALSRRLPGAENLLKGRDSCSDVGRRISAGEFERKNAGDIFFANIQRAKESARVLEEFSKLSSRGLALEFKKLRYRLYTAERNASRIIHL
ncbi:MAG: thiamine-phosphate pyrophosphorylase [Candidatus Omnitrophota bacterium]|nr:thiamine-phosphate pyrophosphorylase [Candidatus Omnitrophota bacterium]